jgi:hypothetical protein
MRQCGRGAVALYLVRDVALLRRVQFYLCALSAIQRESAHIQHTSINTFAVTQAFAMGTPHVFSGA